ncbi:acetate kinase [Planosporangium thailandense]|uniref:Acetate kinase n=1 Tax=Planosporangium thailandense TaxID=765197 RepID=A0ABX0Y4G5_9ACTN|nr:acetate kinase [Planosporangium thailandense]NJC72445.1 acetate kinase [Planosporangium thailandense]
MILVLNSGSSSLKYALFDGAARVAAGTVERIGEPGSPTPDHEAAIAQVADQVGLSTLPLDAIGHRVVHGGAGFQKPTVIDDDVAAEIRSLIPLAPLHNPANLQGIDLTRRLRPDVPHVAVFDTAFHATLPAAASTYALDRAVSRRYGIRRYGFHGTSCAYVSRRTAALLARPIEELNLIVLHLGNGASATAIQSGRSVETSMGLTPLEGLAMGSRTGDIDPAVAFLLARQAGMSVDDLDDLYHHHGGLRGLCGDNDMRTVLRRAADGDGDARLALDVYCHRIRRYVGAYYAVLGRLDAIAFTAGIGENSPEVRARTLAGLLRLGITVDPARNATGPAERVISADGAPVSVCVVPTDEERAIAEEVAALLNQSAPAPVVSSVDKT